MKSNQPNPQSHQTTESPEAIAAREAEAARLNTPIEEEAPATRFIDRLLGKKPEVEAEGDAVETEEEKAAKAAAEAANKKVAKPKVARAAPPAREIDEEKLGRSIAVGLAPHLKPAAPEKRDEPADDMPASEKRRMEVLFHMEQMPEFSEKYKGVAAMYKEKFKKASDYKAKWMEEHPGEEWDENSSEHANVLDPINAEIDEAWDEDDYHEALADIRATKRIKEKETELDGRLSEVERAERARKERGNLDAAAAESGAQFWNEMGDEFKGIITSTGEVDTAALKKLEESDPVAHEIVVGAAEAAENTARVVHGLFKSVIKFDSKDPMHAQLSAFSIGKEQQMLARPAAERQDDDGRMFATKAKFDAMTKAQQAEHWTFTADHIAFMVARAIAKSAQQKLKAEEEKFTRRATARGILKNGQPAKPARKQVAVNLEENEEINDNDGGKPISPESAATPRMAAGKGGNGGTADTAPNRFFRKYLGQS